MRRHNILLLCMITTFLFLVAYIFCNYCKNPSISNIITSDDCKYIILLGMIIKKKIIFILFLLLLYF